MSNYPQKNVERVQNENYKNYLTQQKKERQMSQESFGHTRLLPANKTHQSTSNLIKKREGTLMSAYKDKMERLDTMTKQEQFTKYLLELQSRPKEVIEKTMPLKYHLLSASEIKAQLPSLLQKYTFSNSSR